MKLRVQDYSSLDDLDWRYLTGITYEADYGISWLTDNIPDYVQRKEIFYFWAFHFSMVDQSGTHDPGVVRWYRQTLEGSLTAASKPIFATKYSLESSHRDLHNALRFAAL